MTRLPGLRPPGARLGSGVFRQDIPVLSKNWPHPCGHPAGFPPPARRVIRGPRFRATSRANSRAVRGVCPFVGAHPVRDSPTTRYAAALRSRTRCAPTRERQACGAMLLGGYLWERTLCATNLRSGAPRRGCRAQGALPQASADCPRCADRRAREKRAGFHPGLRAPSCTNTSCAERMRSVAPGNSIFTFNLS